MVMLLTTDDVHVIASVNTSHLTFVSIHGLQTIINVCIYMHVCMYCMYHVCMYVYLCVWCSFFSFLVIISYLA